MNKWLREGKDVNAMLPYLMKYMGHSEVKNTLYYFHLVPDIYGAIVKNHFIWKILSRRFVMKNIKSKNNNSMFFWETAGRFLNHELSDIRKKSHNTISTYRTSLNTY